MEKFTSQTLCDYLQAYGWNFRFDGVSTWFTGWKTDSRFYALRIELNELLISFEVQITFFSANPKESSFVDIINYISKTNRELKLLKLSMDSNGVILLSCDVLSESFTYNQFNHILGVFGYYGDVLSEELSNKLLDLKFDLIHNSNLYLM